MKTPSVLRVVTLLASALSLFGTGCGGGGRYGYSREYVFLPDERAIAERADETAVYDEVRRLPDRFTDRTLSWWGVVTEVESASNGSARVTMQLRTHQPRHLCADETDASCRVTINERDGGSFTALVQLTPDDQAGENRVQTLSMMHVYGAVVQGEYNREGGPILRTQFYRHWPRGQYVTTGASAGMRR
ncbi:MAG: hypothetical protein Q8Q09_20355 [Deltaproteobacteria bacterium]|nr:hypothetical protein [Deltaproteobacteria bacterium]